MSRQEIQSLFVNRGTDHLIYQKSAGNEPVYLVRSMDGTYKISLKSGQYGFGSNETGAGQATIDLVGGGIHDAEVVSTIPETLPEGSTDAIDIVLIMRK